MKVKITNPRGGTMDIVSAALRLTVPPYVKDMLVDLPPENSQQWIDKLKKDGLVVTEISDAGAKTPAAEPAPSPVIQAEPEPAAVEEKKPDPQPRSGGKFAPANKSKKG